MIAYRFVCKKIILIIFGFLEINPQGFLLKLKEDTMKTVTIVITLAFAMLAPYVSADDYKVIDFGYYSMQKGQTPWIRFIENQLEWETFYEELLEDNEIGRLDFCGIGPIDEAHCIEPPPIPTVDFESNQVIAGGIGARPVEEKLVVSSVETLGDHRLISVVLLRTTETDGPTAPPTLYDDTMLVVEIPKSDLPISATVESALMLLQ
jgi:hypothetical protein